VPGSTSITPLSQAHKKTGSIFIALFLLYVPVAFGVAMLGYRVFKTYLPGFIFAGMWIVAWVVTGVRLTILRYRMTTYTLIAALGESRRALNIINARE
jgi:hypothetical protein